MCLTHRPPLVTIISVLAAQNSLQRSSDFWLKVTWMPFCAGGLASDSATGCGHSTCGTLTDDAAGSAFRPSGGVAVEDPGVRCSGE